MAIMGGAVGADHESRSNALERQVNNGLEVGSRFDGISGTVLGQFHAAVITREVVLVIFEAPVGHGVRTP